ncbi:hypothetical protein [Agromyces sp. NPDC057865]|uniref:hypothetical protein n=1 Tax=Agromyces sp. NPDC057865 TaxID=3346267 RepID=UPI00366DC664
MSLPEQNPRKTVLEQMIGGAISAIPGIGPVVSGAYLGTIAASAREKDEEWLAMVSARLKFVERELEARGEALEVDGEFIGLFNKAFREARETGEAEKRQILAGIVAHAVDRQSFDWASDEEWLDLTFELSPRHIHVMSFFYDPADWIRSTGEDVEPLSRRGGNFAITIDDVILKYLARGDERRRDRVVSTIRDLERRDLLVVPLGSNRSAYPALQPRTTPRGNQLVEFLRRCASDD